MRLICCCSVPFLLLLIPGACEGGNILAIPTEGSHWINMEVLLKALHSRGHNITVAHSSKSWFVVNNSSFYSTLTVPVERGVERDFVQELLLQMIKFQRGTLPLTTVLHLVASMFSKMSELHRNIGEFVPALLDDPGLVRKLHDGKFDLVLTDPSWGNGVIVAKYLNLPLVYNVRWLIPEDAQLAIAPSPLSYIPIVQSGFTDKMTFFERVVNMLLYLVGQIQMVLASKLAYQPLCEKYLGPDHDFDQIKIDADIWLMRTDFVFDFPRPTMPNVVYMGGFHCKDPEPLPEHLEEFVQSSGEHGFIIMSHGAFVSKLPDDVADEVAAAFAKLPQKVIWTYKGNRPTTLGNNTLLVDWMPQKDLLAHPKIKLFVAHGGTNGVQEAICHGVPLLGLPLVFDQYDNLLRVRQKRAAKILSLSTVNEDNFLKGLQEVLTEPSYRTNMQRLSRLHKDQPMKPIDTALFWIEFVMRHKGAAHLKAQSYKMPWYIYHSVDVVLFLTGVTLLVVFTLILFIRCFCSAVCRRKIKRE
uniref:UDP-glucuronosyltransferase n=2 Tax=Nothobranchius furzeri TaxID=105023 RepID=A0A1A8UH84_NOTFU|nr:UDP-glucuronosyltransferase 2C1-like isoform X2 [Nothobranchius furzeri]XP_054587871.1 UDP-glucuronosyltransferase 2C1-like [Nothobranchius furzeri]